MQLFQKLIPVSVCFIVFISCAQNKQRPIDQLYKNTKQLEYPSMPQYYIEGYQSGCFYEIYVNGILAFNHYRNTGLANHAVPINDLILKSGPQKVTVKLFPLGQIGDHEFPLLTSKSRFDLTIFKRDKATPWEGADYDVVHKYFAPTTTGESHGPFKNKDLPYFEETFTFNAEVPYELEGWSNSQNLKEMDQDLLEKEILDFYKNYADVIYQQDEEAWVKLIKKRELEYFKAVYYNDEKSKSLKNRIKDFELLFDSEFKERFPLNNFSIVFGANGRIVTLKSIDRLGKSAFSSKLEKEINGEILKVRKSSYLFLHKPKGSNTLEIIR